MKSKIKTFLTTLFVAMVMIISISITRASASEVGDLVKEALVQKNFYHFNRAYGRIMEMPETSEKYNLLNQLQAIQSTVWTDEINKSLAMIADIAKTGSDEVFEEAIMYLINSKLGEVDKKYLLDELTSWGRKLVFTEDFNNALKDLIAAKDKKDIISISNALASISKVKNKLNRDYLMDDLNLLISTIKNIPTELRAMSDGTTIKIQWNPIEGADYYYLYYSTTIDGTYTPYTNNYGIAMGFKWAEKFSVYILDSPIGITEYFKVTAVKNGVESSFSNIASITP